MQAYTEPIGLLPTIQRKCFAHVKPSVFHDACVKQSVFRDDFVGEFQRPENIQAACKVTASYVNSARFQDCQLSLPKDCDWHGKEGSGKWHPTNHEVFN